MNDVIDRVRALHQQLLEDPDPPPPMTPEELRKMGEGFGKLMGPEWVAKHKQKGRKPPPS